MSSRLLTARSAFQPPPARRAGNSSLSRLVSFSRRPNTAQVPAGPRSSRAVSSSSVGGTIEPAPPGSSSSLAPFDVTFDDEDLVWGLLPDRGRLFLLLSEGGWAGGSDWPMTRRREPPWPATLSAGTEAWSGGRSDRHIRSGSALTSSLVRPLSTDFGWSSGSQPLTAYSSCLWNSNPCSLPGSPRPAAPVSPRPPPPVRI